jgi:hypothetical protein
MILIYAQTSRCYNERRCIDLMEFLKCFGLNIASNGKFTYIGMYLLSDGSYTNRYLGNGPQSQNLDAIVLDFEKDVVDSGVGI